MFCRTWQNMGGTVYLDPTAPIHVGHYTFRGNIRKLFTGENKIQRAGGSRWKTVPIKHTYLYFTAHKR